MKKILEKLAIDFDNKDVISVNDDCLSKGHYSYDIGENLLDSSIQFTIYDEKKYGDGEVYFNINFSQITEIKNDVDNIYIIEQIDQDEITIIFEN